MPSQTQVPIISPPKEKITSLLDKMVAGREFESILKYKAVDVNLGEEIKRAIAAIQETRKKPLICYMANVINPNIKSSTSININDDLPFSEMIASVPDDVKEIDLLLVTPGGSAQQVAIFVDRLRPRFDKVTFILPNMAMSAGTIFTMSGDEIIMDSRAYIGPIDPQIPNSKGQFMPAQAILTLIGEIQKRGEGLLKKGQNPLWTDLQILKLIDAKEIGNAINASDYSIELVENYLYEYKFRTWIQHSDKRKITDVEKRAKAKEIAEILCNHALWKTHSRGINRENAWNICKLKIIHPESIKGLHDNLRQFWALMYWIFENTLLYKIFISENYSIFRTDITLKSGK